ncbi:MAG: hypothetical protein KGI50_05255 [Patescibacteria group bacterium]|nr:hypothetical protein [Patescibacteria group bacterium]MDE2438733.1 hypothetical protein [Patescibacteria group bacterium]
MVNSKQVKKIKDYGLKLDEIYVIVKRKKDEIFQKPISKILGDQKG